MYESDDKMVSHPDHYQSKTGLEVIDVIEAFTDGLNGIEATDTGNIIKYACRWKQKNGVQDLKKIMWYTQHLIDHLEKNTDRESSVVTYRCKVCGCTFVNPSFQDLITHIGIEHHVPTDDLHEVPLIVGTIQKYFNEERS